VAEPGAHGKLVIRLAHYSVRPTGQTGGVPLDYAERAPEPDLAGVLVCTWTSSVRGAGVSHVLPDASLDIIWLGDRLVVAGPDTRPRWVPVPGEVAAVRFRPGAAAGPLGLPVDEIRDQTVPLAELWGPAGGLADRLAAAPDPAARVRILQAAVRDRLAELPAPDPLPRGLVVALGRTTSGPRGIATLARDLGVSERQLHRRAVAAFGYGPKMLDRVLRLQRFLALARSGRGGLAELAVHAGYTDQPHLTREARALAGITPATLIGAAGPARDGRSVQDGGDRPTVRSVA
jgi:AraC-like DNA-binding protein